MGNYHSLAEKRSRFWPASVVGLLVLFEQVYIHLREGD